MGKERAKRLPRMSIKESTTLVAPGPEDRDSKAAIDIFQKLVAASRSPDLTMCGLAQWILDNQGRVTHLSISSVARETGGQRDNRVPLLQATRTGRLPDLRFALAESRGLALGTQLAGRGAGEGRSTEHPFTSIMRRVDRRQLRGAAEDDEPRLARGAGRRRPRRSSPPTTCISSASAARRPSPSTPTSASYASA